MTSKKFSLPKLVPSVIKSIGGEALVVKSLTDTDEALASIIISFKFEGEIYYLKWSESNAEK